jgi:hypothetical protein
LKEKQLLKEQQQPANNCCCSSNLELPDEFPGVEDALKTSAATVKVLDLGLIVEDDRKDSSSSSSTTVVLELPDEFPGVEDALKTSAATVKVLDSDLFFKRRRSLKKQFFFFFFSQLSEGSFEVEGRFTVTYSDGVPLVLGTFVDLLDLGNCIFGSLLMNYSLNL